MSLMFITLACDTNNLLYEKEYNVLSAGVIDVFPHKAHVESVGIFEK